MLVDTFSSGTVFAQMTIVELSCLAILINSLQVNDANPFLSYS